MKKQNGFTLIELVVVIVILGILAVTAAPRFLNLQSDARTASLNGLKGAMQGGAGVTYGKAVIQGQDGDSGSISAATGTIVLVHGYPKASKDGIGNAVAGLKDVAEKVPGQDWKVVNVSSASSSITYTFANQQADSVNDCYVTYNDAAKNSEPVITVKKCE